MELKVSTAIFHQMERWKQTDSCYQKAVLGSDAEKMLGLENCFISMARKAIFECMVYTRIYRTQLPAPDENLLYLQTAQQL